MCVSHSVTGPSETCFFQSFKTENIAYTTPCTPHHCADTHHLHHTPPTRSQLHHPPTCELFLLQLTVREVECRLGLHEASENARSSASRKAAAAAAAAAALRTKTRCHTYIHHLISIHHTPLCGSCPMLTAVFFQMAPPNPHLLAVGTRVSQNLSQAPKEEVVSMLRTNGHNAIQRNIRHGNIYMICKDCDATCSVSTYRNDAWCVTKRHDAVGRQCQKSADAPTKKSQKGDAGKTHGRQRKINLVSWRIFIAAGRSRSHPYTVLTERSGNRKGSH